MIVLDLRLSGIADYDDLCPKSLLVATMEFAQVVHRLDKHNLLRAGAPLETLTINVLVTTKSGSVKVVHVLRNTRPSHISLKSLWQRVKQVLTYLLQTGASGAAPSTTAAAAAAATTLAPNFDWLERAIPVAKAPAKGAHPQTSRSYVCAAACAFTYTPSSVAVVCEQYNKQN